MKLIVSGSRECKDRKLVYEVIEEGIKELGKPSCILHGDCRGVDKLAEDWAKENGVNFLRYPADWNDIKCQGAIVKERINPWTKKKEKYNANAGFQRNEKMAIDADALIVINIGNTPGTKNMLELGKQYNLKIYEYQPKLLNTGDFEINF